MSPRKYAIENKLSTYVAIKPCKRCGDYTKYTSNSRCKSCSDSRPVHPKHSEYTAKWRSGNKEKIRHYQKEYQSRLEVKAARAKKQKERECFKRNATFITNQELHDLVMNETYLIASLRTNITGVKHHVDHIIPLKGKNVCGFHSWNNVRVIPASENLSKSNKLIEE